MSPFRRPSRAVTQGRDVYYVDLRWKGYPRVALSTDSGNKARAGAMEATLRQLRDAGRHDLLSLLAAGRVDLPELHDAWLTNRDALEQLKARAESPTLGGLVNEWLAWLKSPAGVSSRTRRRITPKTARRYAVSWAGFFAVLPRGREAQLSDLTRGLVADYRVARQRATGGRKRLAHPERPLAPATFNRDLAALGAFLRWVREEKGLPAPTPKLPREREPQGRIRWLSADELAAFERQCPAEWWPLFAMLVYTGMRIGEAQGLRGGDVLLSARRITIHEGGHRVKTAAAVRDVPIPGPLESALASHLARVGPGPADLVFQGPMFEYPAARRMWHQVCAAAEIREAHIHDCRHTFAVHAMQAGVPIVQLQKLLGHATALMTLRYAQHAPQAYLDADATAIAGHMAGVGDQEAEARVAAARKGMRTA